MKANLSIVTTVKASKQELMEFVAYHLNTGIHHIFLFFDDPNDNNLELFDKNKQVSSIPCTNSHWKKLSCSAKSDIEIRQKANANLAINLAKTKGSDWISHIDIDELLYSEHPLTNIIINTPTDVAYIWLRPYEAIPSNETCLSAFQEINQFKVLSKSKLKQLRSQTTDTKILENILYHKQFFRGHMGGKSIVRITDNIDCIGIHKPLFKNETNIKINENNALHLLHYDCYSFENWLTKWERRYDGTATFNGRKNRKEQYNEFSKAYEMGSKNQLLILYRQQYLLSTTEKKLLKKFELIKTIGIPNYLFI